MLNCSCSGRHCINSGLESQRWEQDRSLLLLFQTEGGQKQAKNGQEFTIGTKMVLRTLGTMMFSTTLLGVRPNFHLPTLPSHYSFLTKKIPRTAVLPFFYVHFQTLLYVKFFKFKKKKHYNYNRALTHCWWSMTQTLF